MDNLGQLHKKIEYVRSSLNALAAEKNTTDPQVTQLSISLDELIVHYVRQKANLNRQRG
jgi:ABC-type transporter Mla subunit MlaD